MIELAAYREADLIRELLPRKRPDQPNIFGHIDASGRLVLTVIDKGTLFVEEEEQREMYGDLLNH